MEKEVFYKVVRSRRRTLVLTIDEDGVLTVRSPHFVSDVDIRRIVDGKKSWILEKQRLHALKQSESKSAVYVDGGEFLFFGKRFTLRVIQNADKVFEFKNGFYLDSRFLSGAREIFVNWYKKELLKFLYYRVEFFSRKLNVSYKKISVSNSTKCWGSCSKKGYLNFSWRLAMAPLNIIEYVVVHEVSHLVEANHSKKFWNLVASYIFDHEFKRKWLNKNGHMLNL